MKKLVWDKLYDIDKILDAAPDLATRVLVLATKAQTAEDAATLAEAHAAILMLRREVSALQDSLENSSMCRTDW